MPRVEKPQLNGGNNRCRIGDIHLLLDLYCAEILARGPASLTLRKIWTPFDPAHRQYQETRGYYVLVTRGRHISGRCFALTELAAARAYFKLLATALGGAD